MVNTPRPLSELLNLVGAYPGRLFTGRGIVDAYNAGEITTHEARKLQQFSHRSFAGQKRALRLEMQSTPEGMAKLDRDLANLRAKLEDVIPKTFPHLANHPNAIDEIVSRAERDEDADD